MRSEVPPPRATSMVSEAPPPRWNSTSELAKSSLAKPKWMSRQAVSSVPWGSNATAGQNPVASPELHTFCRHCGSMPASRPPEPESVAMVCGAANPAPVPVAVIRSEAPQRSAAAGPPVKATVAWPELARARPTPVIARYCCVVTIVGAKAPEPVASA
jgi:hypothetical protein